MASRLDGQLRFYSSSCRDEQEQVTYGPSYLTVSAKGEWAVHPLPTDPDKRGAKTIDKLTLPSEYTMGGFLSLGDGTDAMFLLPASATA